MKNRNYNSLNIKIIVGAILILYVLFLYMDFYNVRIFIASKYIKYLCILLCFILSILSNKNPFIDTVKRRDIFLIRLALFLTAIADLCLVIFDFYILGVCVFSLVQITYCVRYSMKKVKRTLVNFFIVFEFIGLSYVMARIFIGKVNSLVPISLFYAICLLTSVAKAIRAWKNDLYPFPNNYMIVLGMVLFLLCDLCVALSNITEILPLSEYFIINIRQISTFLIWVFYLPSQLLLALSGRYKSKIQL
jgi:hypothetical protein